MVAYAARQLFPNCLEVHAPCGSPFISLEDDALSGRASAFSPTTQADFSKSQTLYSLIAHIKGHSVEFSAWLPIH